VHYRPRFLGIQINTLAATSHAVRGVALSEGTLTLAVAVALLVAGVSALFVSRIESRVPLAGAAAATGVFLVGFAVFETTQVHDVALDRYNPFRSDSPLAALHLRELLSVSYGYGLYLVMAGGVVTVLGAWLLARARRPATAS
jgi:hypothetical protein